MSPRKKASPKKDAPSLKDVTSTFDPRHGPNRDDRADTVDKRPTRRTPNTGDAGQEVEKSGGPK